MSFDEVRLPVEVERGASGGPGFNTTINLLSSGREQRNQNWAFDRGRWQIGYGVQERSQALEIRDFFLARRGKARGFRFRDWSNYQALTQMPCDEQAEGSELAFRPVYRYVDAGGYTYEKTIYKPVASGFEVYLDGVLRSPASYDLDVVNGLIIFPSPPEYGSDVTWKGTFDIPVRFDTDELQAVITTREVISFPILPVIEIKL